MDIFCEYMIKRRKSSKDMLICMGSIFAAVFLTMFIFLVLFGRVMGLEVFVIAAVWYGAVTLIRRTDVEYEYILTNSVLDIDKIMAKKTRKRIISIDFKSIEECAPAPKHNRGTANGAKVLDLTSDLEADGVYFADFFKDSQKIRVYFQPNEKILKNIKMVNPRLVTVAEGDLQ